MTRCTAGFVFAETAYAPKGRAASHDHATIGLAVVRSGGFRKAIGQRTYDCRPSTLTVEPAGVCHAEDYGTAPVRSLLIEVLPSRAASLAAHGLSFPDPVCRESDAALLLSGRLRHELREQDDASELVLEGLGLELVAIAHRLRGSALSKVDKSAGWLLMIRERLRSDFRSHITLDELATAGGVHPAHMARAFRTMEGCSIGDFVRRLRIAWSAERLGTTDETIASIAVSAGYYDQSHFARAFAREMGVSPARYRRRVRNTSGDRQQQALG